MSHAPAQAPVLQCGHCGRVYWVEDLHWTQLFCFNAYCPDIVCPGREYIENCQLSSSDASA